MSTEILSQFEDPALTGTERGPRRTRLQDRVPIDTITADARQAKPGRAILGLIGGLLFALGWVAAKIFGVLFLAGAWCFSAVKIGWRSAQGKALSQPSVEQLLAENAQLRLELSRVT
jgi:hypothetical protein